MAAPTTEAEIAAVFAPTKDFTLGCMFAELIIDTFLAGLMTVQAFTYFKWQNDGWWTKGLVIACCIMNTGITAFVWFFVQHLFVEGFGTWAFFAETKYIACFPLLDAFNAAIVQAFFTFRAYRLCKRIIVIPIIIGALILTSIAFSIGSYITSTSSASLFLAKDSKVYVCGWCVSIMTADIVITVCILWGLARSKSGWAATDKTVSRLIRMTLEAQVPPTILAITFLVIFARDPSSLLAALLATIQPKFYAVGLLYALNVRLNFQSHMTTSEHNGTVAKGQVFAMTSRGGQNRTNLQVDVETETYIQTSDFLNNNRGPNLDPYGNEDKKDLDFEDPHVRFNSQARLTGA